MVECGGVGVTPRARFVRTVVRCMALALVVAAAARSAWEYGAAPAASLAVLAVLYVLGRLFAAEVRTWLR